MASCWDANHARPERADEFATRGTRLPPRHHLFIAGTGRAGTSFLVRYLAALGLETHIARHGTDGWDAKASAGFEDLPIPGQGELLPYVVKSPWLSECIDAVLADTSIRIDAVIIPVRDLAEAATSRMVIERQAMHANAPFMAHLTRPWQTHGITPGGAVFSLDPVDQARLLAVGFHVLIQRLVRADIPIVFLDFPRFALDWRYTLERLHPYLPAGIDEQTARAVHERIADPMLLRTGDEIATGDSPAPLPNAPLPAALGVPGNVTVENAALRRELVALRGDLAMARATQAETAYNARESEAALRAELAAVRVAQAEAADRAQAAAADISAARAAQAATAHNAQVMEAALRAELAATRAAQATAAHNAKVLEEALTADLESAWAAQARTARDVQALEAAVATIHASTSWRITAPLRSVGRFIKRRAGR